MVGQIKIVIFLSLTAIVFVTIIYFNINDVQLYTRKNGVSAREYDWLSPLRGRTILFWNSFFDDTQWVLKNDTVLLECPYAQCIFTNNHNFLPSVQMYDAIVFHTTFEFKSLPVSRDWRQLYVFSQLESPKNTLNNLRNRNSFFNLTMTYRLDSDVTWNYNEIIDKETEMTIAPAFDPKWRKVNTAWTQNDKNLLTLIGKKRKGIAWFVSNCQSPSGREHIVEQMQQIIPVDIFGKCGNKTCQRGNAECNDILDNDYKFYLSFENSLCQDYVTEKLFNALRRNIVPVVYGGANYTRFAPPHSHIDVNSFPNVTSLVAYLIYLNENPKEYAKYFWWRRFYKVRENSPLPFCDLCYTVDLYWSHQRTQIYQNIHNFWNKNACIS